MFKRETDFKLITKIIIMTVTVVTVYVIGFSI